MKPQRKCERVPITLLVSLLFSIIFSCINAHAEILVDQLDNRSSNELHTAAIGTVSQLNESEAASYFELHANVLITKLVWSGGLQPYNPAGEDFVIRIYETVENGPALKPIHEFVTSAVVHSGGLHLIFTAELECELMLSAGRYWISFLSSGTRGNTFFLANEKEAGSPEHGSGGAVRENINQPWRSRNIDSSFLAGKGFSMQLHGDHKGFVLDNRKIFFAGDSSGTCCHTSMHGNDVYQESLFNRLREFPPPGFTIEPHRPIKSITPCNASQPRDSGYGGLKILDWRAESLDPRGNGVCGWTCLDCPEPDGVREGKKESELCCCASRKSCIDQSVAQYVILLLLNNDLLHLYDLYGGDVDRVVEAAKGLISDLTSQSRIVIWISYSPIGLGKLGKGEKSCSGLMRCLFAINSNAEYFYAQLIPWIEKQPRVHIIDFFGHIKQLYGSSVKRFYKTYQYDKTHLNP